MSSTNRISYCQIRDKSNWCLTLIIEINHQECSDDSRFFFRVVSKKI